jgi:polar amino acid transport system substrate-binding protein
MFTASPRTTTPPKENMSTYRTRSVSLRSLATIGVLALALIASGCGSSSPAATTAAAAPETTVAGPAETTPAAAPATDSATPVAADAVIKGAVFNQELHDALPAAMKTSGTMTLATDPTDPPLEFYNEKNELVGSEVDLAAALGTVLGIKVSLVPSKFDAIIPGIQAGRFDGSVSGFADRKERAKVVDFVDYFTSSRGYLFRTGTMPDAATKTDLCGLKVAVAKGTTMADSLDALNADCVKNSKKAIDSQIFPDQAACVLAVQSSRSDLTIFSDHAALWIAKNSKGALEVALRPTEGNDINGIVLKKGELTVPVQKAIQQLMDSGTFAEIFTKWNLQALILKTATVNAGTN